MAAPSRNSVSSDAKDQGVVLTNPTIAGTRTGGGSREDSSASSFSGIANEEALGILMDFIRQTAGGGTAEQRNQRAERNQQIVSTRGTLADYTKQNAFTDAADLMAQNLRKSMEANMPAISRSIQGAGTSASSMQGLLSQKLAIEGAQAAGAMGAEQAKAYGGISAQLQGVLEMLTRIDPSIEANLLKALELTKVSTQSQRSSRTTDPIQETGQSGGGSYFQPLQQQQALDSGNFYSGSRQQAPSYGPGEGYVVNNNSGQGTIFNSGATQDFYTPTAPSYSDPNSEYDYGPAQEDTGFSW